MLEAGCWKRLGPGTGFVGLNAEWKHEVSCPNFIKNFRMTETEYSSKHGVPFWAQVHLHRLWAQEIGPGLGICCGRHQEHPPMASLHGLGFFTAYWLDPKSEYREGERQSEVTVTAHLQPGFWSHVASLLHKSSHKYPPNFKERGMRFPLLMGSAKVLDESVGQKYCCGHLWKI